MDHDSYITIGVSLSKIDFDRKRDSFSQKFVRFYSSQSSSNLRGVVVICLGDRFRPFNFAFMKYSVRWCAGDLGVEWKR